MNSCSATASAPATAAPAGPAFEGAAIRCGMRAAPGAIEVVKLTPQEIELGVIGDEEPVGLCGSGLVDAVAELVRSWSDRQLREVRPDEEAAQIAPGIGIRLTKIGEERVFVLHWRGEPGELAKSVYLSQRDVPSCSSPRPRSRPVGASFWRSRT